MHSLKSVDLIGQNFLILSQFRDIDNIRLDHELISLKAEYLLTIPEFVILYQVVPKNHKIFSGQKHNFDSYLYAQDHFSVKYRSNIFARDISMNIIALCHVSQLGFLLFYCL